ncbi:hypothetical protein [Sodalis sp.]|uniref:hypothetical protein n=1 Tax=Sodalis sp. (in: enterobacteria) TaxID=1898979 RepID=UPI00387320A8
MDELFDKQADAVAEPVRVDGALGSSLTDQGDPFTSRRGYRAEEYRWGQGEKIIDFDIQAGGEHYPAAIDSTSQTDVHVKVLFDRDFDTDSG